MKASVPAPKSRTSLDDRWLIPFHGKRHGIAAAKAKSGDAALQVAALQFVKQRHEYARATGTDGMAERHRPPVRVLLFRIELELPRDRDRGYRERFIEFHQIHILVPIPPGLRQ